MIISSTLYADVYHDLQDKLDVDSFQYDMKLGFLFNEYISISISHVNVTFEIEMKFLIELSQNCMTSICVTLLKKNVPESEHKDFDGGDRNVNDFWNTVEIARENNVIISETIVRYHDLTIRHRIPLVVQDS